MSRHDVAKGVGFSRVGMLRGCRQGRAAIVDHWSAAPVHLLRILALSLSPLDIPAAILLSKDSLISDVY